MRDLSSPSRVPLARTVSTAVARVFVYILLNIVEPTATYYCSCDNAPKTSTVIYPSDLPQLNFSVRTYIRTYIFLHSGTTCFVEIERSVRIEGWGSVRVELGGKQNANLIDVSIVMIHTLPKLSYAVRCVLCVFRPIYNIRAGRLVHIPCSRYTYAFGAAFYHRCMYQRVHFLRVLLYYCRLVYIVGITHVSTCPPGSRRRG